MGEKNCLVYCLQSNVSPSKTYIGYTNNFPRRLKQHNTGKGARLTRSYQPWRPRFHVINLTQREAMQIEHKLKRNRVCGLSGLEGRLATLERLVRNWPVPLEINNFI